MEEPSVTCSVHEEFERLHRRPRAGRTLIVGSRVYEGRLDRRALYDDVLGVDAVDGPGVDWVLDMEKPLPEAFGTFAHVECRSVLEHSRRPWWLAQRIEEAMEPGATLDLSVPFVWGLHAYPDDYYRFSASGVRELFPNIEWQVLLYADERLKIGGKTLRRMVDGHVYIGRTEVLGFGIRKG